MSSIATVMLGDVFINGGAVIVPRNVVQLASEKRGAASLRGIVVMQLPPVDRCSDQRLNHLDPFPICASRSGDPLLDAQLQSCSESKILAYSFGMGSISLTVFRPVFISRFPIPANDRRT